MTRQEVEAYLREHIPLSAGMAIDVVEADPQRVTIEAPLGPNVNHRSTAFGGSVAALAILTGWTLVHVRLRHEGLVAQTVIQTSSVKFDAPIHGAFRAVSEPVDPVAWERFVRAITRRGKGRLAVSVSVTSQGEVAASFSGAYVSLAPRKGGGAV